MPRRRRRAGRRNRGSANNTVFVETNNVAIPVPTTLTIRLANFRVPARRPVRVLSISAEFCGPANSAIQIRMLEDTGSDSNTGGTIASTGARIASPTPRRVHLRCPNFYYGADIDVTKVNFIAIDACCLAKGITGTISCVVTVRFLLKRSEDSESCPTISEVPFLVLQRGEDLSGLITSTPPEKRKQYSTRANTPTTELSSCFEALDLAI